MKPRITFYAPVKPPDHPIPSGDREIARLLVRALGIAGYEIETASSYIAYQKRPSAELFEQRRTGALAELERLKQEWTGRPARERPTLWLTYHPYCKAPDWIGPAMAEAFSIPYVTAEACRTRQATDADWSEARRQVQAAVRAAAVNICLKQSDVEYLKSFGTEPKSLRFLLPFADIAALDATAAEPAEEPFGNGAPLLVVAAMMRPGAKTDSYLMLAAALGRIEELPWNLVIIGDGPSRPEIEAAFAWLSMERVRWTGAISREEVIGWFRRGDIFAWPGYREAIGLVFLEAQSQGLPVAAFDSLGVGLTVTNHETGLMTSEGDAGLYAEALRALIENEELRKAMGDRARRYMLERHDIAVAAKTLSAALDPLLAKS